MAERHQHRGVELEHHFDRLVEQKLSQVYTLLVPARILAEEKRVVCAAVRLRTDIRVEEKGANE